VRNTICLLSAACLAMSCSPPAPGTRSEETRAEEPVAMRIAAPELKGIQEWINSSPLTLKELRGRVMVLHFWTFG
jgi:hypothetical protein